MPTTPQHRHHASTLADLIGPGYALPGTLASRFMRCGKANCRCKARPADPARPLPALDPHRRRQDRDPHPHPRPGRRYQPWFDNARRLRELLTELEARSLKAFLDAEG